MEISITSSMDWGEIEQTCDLCGGTYKFTLLDVRAGSTVRCSGGHDVELSDADGGISDLVDALENFGR